MNNLRRKLSACSVIVMLATSAWGQFAPAAGLPGSTAMWKDSGAFVNWATGCSVIRGYQIISAPTFFASAGTEDAAIGKAGENGIVSLGDGGSATLTFAEPISNGPGPDFAVFENGFMVNDSNLAFLEFAFVEVSSDGVNFFRFPATSYIQDTVQMAMEGVDCSLVNNLAGKYIANYGTPFDLDELRDIQGLDVTHVTHVKVIDVIGCILNPFATHDTSGHKINDPWPTAFASSGFDLDAVGVINQVNEAGLNELNAGAFKVYPNPVKSGQQLFMRLTGNADAVMIYGSNGQLVKQFSANEVQGAIQLPMLTTGLYFAQVVGSSSVSRTKIVVE